MRTRNVGWVVAAVILGVFLFFVGWQLGARSRTAQDVSVTTVVTVVVTAVVPTIDANVVLTPTPLAVVTVLAPTAQMFTPEQSPSASAPLIEPSPSGPAPLATGFPSPEIIPTQSGG